MRWDFSSGVATPCFLSKVLEEEEICVSLVCASTGTSPAFDLNIFSCDF